MNNSYDTVGSLPEYLSRVEESYTGRYSALFRGHRCDDWDLTPRIARTRFRRRYTSVQEAERRMLDEFERQSTPHIGNRYMASAWDRLAIAQHHGLPTRLLDWTTNPLVALWFAVEMPPERGKDAAVWAFDAEESDYANVDEDPFALPKTLIYRPRHLDARIVAQSGWFTIHKFMNEKGRFSPLNKIPSQKARLRKLIIPKQYFAALRHDLARSGISKATLFSDLSGLCGAITWRFSPLDDEHDYDSCFEP
ncbi:MAG: FRG domain-containing protein [Immundisolibacter sp.]|uniref:FRG domain-containing protein n=1 Tax=Immundisolibacter sp. TaxID=1934948 RepID=UPI003D14A985